MRRRDQILDELERGPAAQRPRVHELSGVVLMTLRSGGGTRHSREVDTIISHPRVTTVQLAPLGRKSIAELLRRSLPELPLMGGQAATGHGLLGFELRNSGATRCHTYGYPGVLFLDRTGAPLPTTPSHTTTDFFGTLPLARVTLASGGTASFRLGVTHGISSTAGCSTAYALQVIPPDDTATLRVTIPNGAFECRTVTVSPLVSGPTAYP